MPRDDRSAVERLATRHDNRAEPVGGLLHEQAQCECLAATGPQLFAHLGEASAEKLPRRDAIAVDLHGMTKVPEGVLQISRLERAVTQITAGLSLGGTRSDGLRRPGLSRIQVSWLAQPVTLPSSLEMEPLPPLPSLLLSYGCVRQSASLPATP